MIVCFSPQIRLSTVCYTPNPLLVPNLGPVRPCNKHQPFIRHMECRTLDRDTDFFLCVRNSNACEIRGRAILISVI